MALPLLGPSYLPSVGLLRYTLTSHRKNPIQHPMHPALDTSVVHHVVVLSLGGDADRLHLCLPMAARHREIRSVQPQSPG
jgi:hypothetical protein